MAAALAVPAQADVTVASWGGAYTMSQQKAYSDTYAPGGINWVNYNGGLGEVRAQVESGNVTWDIIDVLPHEARVGCDEGLFEELPRDVFTPAADGTSMDDDIMVEVPNDCVVPQIFLVLRSILARRWLLMATPLATLQRSPISSTSQISPANVAYIPGATQRLKWP